MSLSGGVQKAELQVNEYKPIVKAIPNRKINGAGSSSEPPLKKKRGRPRKYGPDAKPLAPLAPAALAQDAPAPVAPAAPAAPATVAPVAPAAAVPFAFTAPAPPPAAAPAAAESADPVKKRRGRPRGSSSSNKHGSKGPAGVSSMVPHVIIVKTGEDLTEKILSLSLNGPRNICILTASGAISSITLRKPDTSAGVVTHKGRFEILTLGGSFLFSESGDEPRRYGGMNVSLSGPDGRLMGGGVAGKLVAASPVQVVVASFGGEDPKISRLAKMMGNLSAPPKVATAGQSSSSSGGPGSPLNQSAGTCNNNNDPPQGISDMQLK